MAVSNQSNPRKSHSLNTSQTIVKKKPANRKKGTLKIKQKVWHVWPQSIQIKVPTRNEDKEEYFTD